MNRSLLAVLALLLPLTARAKDAPAPLKPGDPAPVFSVVADNGKTFDLESRRGHWTVLYFYPKAGTPGCTKQACAFRDGIDAIRKTGAAVYGISRDTLKAQRRFKKEHHLPFTLIPDPHGEIIGAYGTEGFLGYSKRWTFILDPKLTIRWVERDVDPALDAQRVAAELEKLQAAQ
ncbi:MAG: peroxiredoxin [Elusimicrobia bacterium]|nr:peroxiredoxin [Elusimicrobiota bacterium]